MKQILAIIGLFTVLNVLGDTCTRGDFSYSYDIYSKEATITSYSGSDSHITFPTSFTVSETYKDEDDGETHTRHHTIKVTRIGNTVFENKEFITSVSFHNNIKSIGTYAFRCCTGLTSIRTPASLTSLGSGAFWGCSNLEEADIEGAALSLKYCQDLFRECINLRRVKFGDGVVSLYANGDDSTLYNCQNLESVIVGSGVTEIPNHFLHDCGSSVEQMSVSFAAPITKVGSYALHNNKITSLTMSVQDCEIGYSAFETCDVVSFDNIDFSKVKSVGSYAFGGCWRFAGHLDLSNVTSIGSSAFQWCTGITEVAFSNKLTNIGTYAFRCCTGLTSIRTPASLTSLGSGAFWGCSNLEEADIEGAALSLKYCQDLFRECINLRRVKFGDGVVSLYANGDDSTLYNCQNLESVIVGSGVTEIPNHFLHDCGSSVEQMSVSFAAPITKVGSYALHNNKITSLTMSVQDCEIGYSAFETCDVVSFDNIDFSKVKSVGSYAFGGCWRFAGHLDLSNVTSIGSSAFQWCTGVESITWPEHITSISDRVFQYCDKLEEVFIPSSVTSIGAYAFYECPALCAITIPASVTTLGSSSFGKCSSLEKVYFKGPPPSTGDNYVFSGVKSGAEGYYTVDNETAWKEVIDSNGYWKGLKMRPSYYKFIYDSNNGSGETVTRIIEKGTDYAIEDIQFSLDGYSFMGWTVYAGEVQTSAFVVTGDECNNNNYDEMRCCANYCKLEPHSANWQEGLLTLEGDGFKRCDVNNLTVYCSSDDANWESLDTNEDEVALKIEGDKLTMTDKKFASRLGGIEPIMYKVRYQSDNGAACEVKSQLTRNRYGIFVSPGEYPSANPNYAETFGDLAAAKDFGGFKKVYALTGPKAVYDEIDKAFKEIAASNVKAGDVCFLYFGTHGSVAQNSTVAQLALSIGFYSEKQLAEHVKLLNGVDAEHPDGNGVAVVGFVHACHSKAVYDDKTDSYCATGSWCVNSSLKSNNSAWITATDDINALSYGDFFSKFLLDYGWKKGWALTSETSNALSCYELVDYTRKRTDEVFKGLTFKNTENGKSFSIKVGVWDDFSILRNIFIGRGGSHDNVAAPSAPINPKASQTLGARITISCDMVGAYDYLTIITRRKNTQELIGGIAWKDGTTVKAVPATQYDPLEFFIVAINGAGAAVSQTPAEGWVSGICLVTFDAGDGQLPASVDNPRIVYPDNDGNYLVGALPTPILNGYRFDGWWLKDADGNYGLRATEELSILRDIMLYAKWDLLPKYNITFDFLDTTSGKSLGSFKYPDIVSNTPLDVFLKKKKKKLR